MCVCICMYVYIYIYVCVCICIYLNYIHLSLGVNVLQLLSMYSQLKGSHNLHQLAINASQDIVFPPA